MGWEQVVSALFACSFIMPCAVAAYVDVKERRIPNGCVALLVCSGLLLMLCNLSGAYGVLAWLPGPTERLASACAVFVGGLLLETVWRRTHAGTHGMGYGDIKFLTAVALWLGARVIWVVAIACLLALAVEVPRGRRIFAFGPYLVIASLGCLLLPLLAT